MSLVELGRSAARNWFLLLLCAVAAVGATLAITSQQTREYRSTSRLVVGPSAKLTRATRIAVTVDALGRRTLIATFAEIVGSSRIFDTAAARVGLSPAGASQYTASSNALPDANVVLLDVTGPRIATTTALSTAIGAAATRYVEGFYKTYSMRALDVPYTPRQPVSPRVKRDVSAAAVGGLGLGLILGLWRDQVRSRRKQKTAADAPPSSS